MVIVGIQQYIYERHYAIGNQSESLSDIADFYVVGLNQLSLMSTGSLAGDGTVHNILLSLSDLPYFPAMFLISLSFFVRTNYFSQTFMVEVSAISLCKRVLWKNKKPYMHIRSKAVQMA